MAKPRIAPYGAWTSPITSDLIVSATVRIGCAMLDNDTVYWLEGRPTEGGRYVIVRRMPDGSRVDVNPPPTNARTRVHEYGGGAVIVCDDTVYFSNFSDQRLYRTTAGTVPVPITPDIELRYADGLVDRVRDRIICVREDHREATTRHHGGEAVNTIAAISLSDGAEQQVLVAGNDFYASPQLSPDGSRLAWLTWNHPNMPWDGCELWIAAMDDKGACTDARMVAGGDAESIFQPTWSTDGVLTFVSDRSGWWNLYRWEDGTARCLAEMEAEFGLPQWVFGLSTYAYTSLTSIVCMYTQDGIDHLATLDIVAGTRTVIDTPYTSLGGIVADANRVTFNGGSPGLPWALVALDLETGQLEILRRSTDLTLDPGALSTPESITFPSTDVDGTERPAFGLFYPPQSREFAAPEGEKPPLLVFSHGGPTGSTNSALSLSIQYWTSRGFAVLDVNYGGSTGYGRDYRNQLRDAWGIIDVDDCVNGARYLVSRGEADGNRLAIRGGSAGGYTTLCALTFRDVFHAGASHYGFSDLGALARDTHKFESRYLDRLVGPYPEREDIYVERSPIFHVDNLNCPVIFFQGLQDRVVPKAQAEALVTALEKKGIPVAYLPFEGEQHGFRRAENIKRALDAELVFYGRIFGFTPAGGLEPVTIVNLD
ncbi:MAG: S9 family peptidase [Anaerolineae bacterium]|nr:S9 family peptidase [Anaerolineae bacterium]